MPLIISHSLRSVVAAPDSTESIVSILLTSADFEKLDLSQLQLFSVDGISLRNDKIAVSSSRGCAEGNNAAPPGSVDRDLCDKLAIQGEDVTQENGGAHDDDFSFQTPLILSPGAELFSGGGDDSFPIFKSRGVVEAERATAGRQLLRGEGQDSPPAAKERKKAVSMDEFTLDEQWIEKNSVVKAQDDSGVSGVRRRRRRSSSTARMRLKAPLPELEVEMAPSPDLDETAEKAETLGRKRVERILSKNLNESTDEATINLRASPAAKFLLQIMPWELTPSPITPANTRASIPFLWEDVPGKPKPRELASPFHSLPLPPRLVSVPSSASKFPGDISISHGRHRNSTYSWCVLQNLFPGHHRRSSKDEPALELGSSDNAIHSPEPTAGEAPRFPSANASNSVEPSLAGPSPRTHADTPANGDTCEDKLKVDYQLPSPYVATIVPRTSPYRYLGPTDDECVDSNLNCFSPGRNFKCFANMFRRGRGKRVHLLGSAAYFHRFGSSESRIEGNSYLLEDGEERPKSGVVCEKDATGNSPCFDSKRVAATDANWAMDERRIVSKKRDHLPETFPSTTTYRSSVSGKRKTHRKGGSRRVLCRLRRRGSRFFVATYRAIKRALLLRRPCRRKLLDNSHMQYQALE